MHIIPRIANATVGAFDPMKAQVESRRDCWTHSADPVFRRGPIRGRSR